MLINQGLWEVPGIGTLLTAQENIVWWGIKERQVVAPGCLIDGASRDSGNTDTTVLRTGLLMGQNQTTLKYTQWSPTATDGTEVVAGPLLLDMNMQDNGSNKDRFGGFILVAGNLKAANLIIPGNASLGIAGDNNEFKVRELCYPRFLFDDIPVGNPFGGYIRTVTKTADYTVLTSDNNTEFNNLGASGNVNFTLPAPLPGLRFVFMACVAAENVTVTAAATGQLITYNNAAATSVSFQTTNKIIGNCVELIGLSTTKWFVRNSGTSADITVA